MDRTAQPSLRDQGVRSAGSALVLVSHGSRDPRAEVVTGSVARAVAAARPELAVRLAGLDHALPRPAAVLAELAAEGHRRVTVAPLLLTAAYHARVDLPAVLAATRDHLPALDVGLAEVLGPDDGLVSILTRRLGEASGIPELDGLVLAAAGTRDAGAIATVAATAQALAARTGLPCRDGYASAAGPTVAEAIRSARVAGAERVGVAAYFLAPGLLYDRARAQALAAGAVAVAAPLGASAELAAVVLARHDAVQRDHRRTVRGAA